MNKIFASILIGLVTTQSGVALAQKASDSSSSGSPMGTQPDNSKSNKVDPSNRTSTARDQMNNAGDVALTKKIRQSVVADETLSTYAHNAKIVAVNGHITLNGVVRSEAEKATLEKKAITIAGQGKVTNDLKVAPKEN